MGRSGSTLTRTGTVGLRSDRSQSTLGSTRRRPPPATAPPLLLPHESRQQRSAGRHRGRRHGLQAARGGGARGRRAQGPAAVAERAGRRFSSTRPWVHLHKAERRARQRAPRRSCRPAGRASQAHAGDEQGDDGAPLGRRCLRCQDSAGCPGELWSISSLFFAFLPAAGAAMAMCSAVLVF